jgi:hypothetical protein
MKLMTTALILALAAPAFATDRGNGNNNGPQSSASVDNRNTNLNSNSATAVAGQHQGQGQIQGQSQANRQTNTQSVNIEDRNQAPGFGVGAAQGTAPCIKPQGLSLSVPLGGAGFHVSPIDQNCLNRETHYMILDALNQPTPELRRAAIISLATMDQHAWRVLNAMGLVRAPN